MEPKIQTLIVTIVGVMGAVALLGAISLAHHGKVVPETLMLLSTNVVSGLCGALGPGAVRHIAQKFTGNNPSVENNAATESETGGAPQ